MTVRGPVLDAADAARLGVTDDRRTARGIGATHCKQPASRLNSKVEEPGDRDRQRCHPFASSVTCPFGSTSTPTLSRSPVDHRSKDAGRFLPVHIILASTFSG